MHKFYENKKYVAFSLTLLRTPPNFKNVVPSFNSRKSVMGHSKNICKSSSH